MEYWEAMHALYRISNVFEEVAGFDQSEDTNSGWFRTN